MVDGRGGLQEWVCEREAGKVRLGDAGCEIVAGR